ncbi:MAG: sodium-dependent phosphate cotransporter [Planctomycetota bacterium]|jgi:sodium-dependent phosphate cotransporter
MSDKPETGMLTTNPSKSSSPLAKALILIGLLYFFLVAIDLMGGSFKLLAKSHAEGLFAGISNPFAALSIGILATVLVQSSSATTSMVVAAVGAGSFSIDIAVFTIMGCNIGTTVTNTLVSLGHVRQDTEFRRAFAGSTMHDFFNLMAVMIFLPLEMATHVLQDSATYISGMIYGEIEGGKISNPLKSAYKAVSGPIQNFIANDLSLSSNAAGIVLLILALSFVFFCLIMITRTMKSLMLARMERTMNSVLEKSGLLAIFIGAVLTVAVQSSSVTTSLMIPLFAAGILKLENGFPVTLGANIGTTVTAFLAALASDQNGLTIAIVHLLFNVGATAAIYPIPQIRHIPIKLAIKLADLTIKNKIYAVLYVVVVFVLIPLGANLILN